MLGIKIFSEKPAFFCRKDIWDTHKIDGVIGQRSYRIPAKN